MTYDKLIEKIKTKGYWRIHFEPLSDNHLNPLIRCKEIVEQNSIELRGWDYPHIPKRTGSDTGFEPGNNFWQAWLEWDEYGHNEFWRMYQSGQFIHYRALSEDWNPDRFYQSIWEKTGKKIKSGEIIGVLSTVYLITEIFQFLFKLINADLYQQGMKVSISLENTMHRQLYADDFMRLPFITDKKTASSRIVFIETYSKKQILNNSKKLALQVILHFFERFGWTPSETMIDSDQEKLLSRNI